MNAPASLPYTLPSATSITRIVWQAALPKGCSKSVLACLAWHAVLNEADQCWPHVDTLARLCGLQRRATENNLKALAKAGLIATTQRPGTSNLYQLNRAALAALSSEQPAAAPAARGAKNAQPPAENDTGGAEKAQDLSFSAPIRKKERREKEEGREREGTPTFPPFPVFEDLKTGLPRTDVDEVLARIADKRAEHLPIGGSDIRRLIEAADASGEVPLAVAAEAVRGCLAAVETPAAAAPALAMAQALPPETAVAIAPDLLAAVNAQRVRNGKAAFKRAELQDLHREATLAGMAPQAAAEWILDRPGRNFFRADFYRPGPNSTGSTPAAPAGPVELTAAGRAAQALRARYESGAGSTPTAATPAVVCPAALASTTPAAARAPALRTVVRRDAAPVSIGAVTGTGWAQRAVARFVAAEPIRHATITTAASALGLSLADLKAQRAAALAPVAA